MKIALVGNQNSGKTTLVNILTNMNSKVGNWPGVTIEKKSGYIFSTNYLLTDLPGIYSLSPYSMEEEISRKYIFEEKPDCIINIIDATCLERSLYLTTQLLELDTNVIVVLNMIDLLDKKGIRINTDKLSSFLGTKVVSISSLKETGIDELLDAIDNKSLRFSKQIFDYNIEKTIMNIESSLNKEIDNKRSVSIKILENDSRFNKYQNIKIKEYQNNLLLKYDNDLEEEIATQRYIYIEKVISEALIINKSKLNANNLDKIFLNKYLSFPIFIVIMFLIYYLSVGVVGKYTNGIVNTAIYNFSVFIQNILNNIGVVEFLNSLIVDGIIGGVGAVLSFIPQLIILFLFISILETTGYMSRISLLLDKLFRKFGLSGKSLIPFIIGTGCSVPGIMSSRIIESEEERIMTSILTPFIPCSAKLPIIVLFTSYFFPYNSGLVAISLYLLSIIIILFWALIFKKYKYKNTNTTYIFELPDYRVPSIKHLIIDVYEKVISFIKKAGSIILICSIIVWFLLSFDFKLRYKVNIETSILATIGKKISWIFYPMIGFDSWAAVVSSIQGLVAKEQVISSMNIISGISNNAVFESDIFSSFNKVSAYSYMVFNLFSIPCLASLSALKKEIGSFKKLLKIILFQVSFAWVLSTTIYQVFSGNINVISLFIILFLIVITIRIIKRNKCTNCGNCSFCKKNNKYF